MNTDLTYPERASAMERAADVERLKRIAAQFEKFGARGEAIKRDTVAAVNLARGIGLELQGLAGAEQMSLGFFKEHCESQLPFGFDHVQRFISIARRSKEPVETIDQALPVMQQVYFAAEVLQLPERRDGPQAAHDLTPPTFFFNTLGTAFERIENRMRDLPKWDVETRESVREQVDRFIAKATELKGKL